MASGRRPYRRRSDARRGHKSCVRVHVRVLGHVTCGAEISKQVVVEFLYSCRLVSWGNAQTPKIAGVEPPREPRRGSRDEHSSVALALRLRPRGRRCAVDRDSYVRNVAAVEVIAARR